VRGTCTTYLVVIWALALLASRAVAQTRGPTIYLGPLVREGFADIATGIRVFSDVNATAHAAVPLKA
jgi:hypothetical protein